MATYVYPGLPVSLTGGATEAKQDAAIALLTTMDADTGSIDTKLTSTNALLGTIDTDTGSIDTKLTSTNSTLSTIAGLDFATQTTLAALNAKVTAVDTGAVVISSGAVTVNPLAVVDFLDSGLIDTSSSNITTAGLSVVSSLAADVKEIEVIEDIGEFMTLTDGSDNYLTYLPLGGGRVKVSITSGTALKIRSLTGSAISLGSIAINFLG